MDDSTWVVLRTYDDDGTKVTHLPTEGRVLARGDRADMLRVAEEYDTYRYRHKDTGEMRTVSSYAVTHTAPGGPLAKWLNGARLEGEAGRVLVIKHRELVHYQPDQPDPPTPGAYRVRVLVPGWATGKGTDTWLPMSRVFTTEGEAAEWAKDLAATYRIEQEDTE